MKKVLKCYLNYEGGDTYWEDEDDLSSVLDDNDTYGIEY